VQEQLNDPDPEANLDLKASHLADQEVSLATIKKKQASHIIHHLSANQKNKSIMM
jgi:hypothetical protein